MYFQGDTIRRMEFSIREMIRFGWETFKKRPWFFAGATLLIAVISAISSQLTGLMNASNLDQHSLFPLFAVGFFVGLIVSILIKMGSINFFLKAHDGVENVSVRDLWAPYPLWKYLLTGVVFGFIVIIGLILLVVPGVVWALRYMFAQYLVMDKHLDVSEALSQSAKMTYGYKWRLLGFGFALAGINILGALCFLVGLLVSIPVSSLAFVHAYRTLSRMAPAA